MPVLGGGGGASFYGSTLEATASGAIADGDPVVLNADGTVSAVASDGAIVANPGEYMMIVGSSTDTIYKYDLSTGFDVTTATYNAISFSVQPQENAPESISFSPDGLKLFMLGQTGDRVYQYEMATPYDISIAAYANKDLYVGTQDIQPLGFAFNNDGTKLFMVGLNTDRVYEYTLPTAYDLSGSSYASVSFLVSGQSANPRGVTFNDDGTKMYITDSNTHRIYMYNLTTGFDISTASYSNVNFYVGFNTNPGEMVFNGDGTKMFVAAYGQDRVYQYDLSTAYDISTSVGAGSFYIGTQELNVSGLTFNYGTQTTTNLSDSAYLGISDGAYTDGATATIQLLGAVDDAQSGMTPGTVQYVQTDGSLSSDIGVPLVEAGYAISATSLVVRGAYNKIASASFKPTPLADIMPQVSAESYSNIYLYQNNTTAHNSGSTTFWDSFEEQGAYVINANLSSFTTIADVSGGGALGLVLTGAFASNADVFVEVTLDDEVREFRAFLPAAGRGTFMFSRFDLLQRYSVGPNAGPDTTGRFHTTYTTPYSQYSTAYSNDLVYIQPTGLTGGLRFKNNMKVRIKSSTAFNTANLRNYHGVLYVVD